MKELLVGSVAITLLFTATVAGQQEETYDYWQYQRQMVRQGQQAVFMCNGLFTSNRTLEQVFAQELAFLLDPVGTASGGDYEGRDAGGGCGDDGNSRSNGRCTYCNRFARRGRAARRGGRSSSST